MSGRWALVLSSGSKRGFAHSGALAALQRGGLKPDLVVGSSAGALVGAIYASGASAAEMAKTNVGATFDSVFDIFFRRTARSARLNAFIERHLREKELERFPIPFAAVAARLDDGCLAVFNKGEAASAVYASMSVPGFFTPATISGVRYCDGGMVSPLPIRVARKLGATTVIAVDVSFHPGWEPPDRFLDAMFYGPLLAVRNLAVLEAAEADLVIRPKLPPVERIEKGDYAAVTMAGDAAMTEALPRIRELLANPPPARPQAPDPRYCA
jgi:NTE family protein